MFVVCSGHTVDPNVRIQMNATNKHMRLFRTQLHARLAVLTKKATFEAQMQEVRPTRKSVLWC